MMPRAESMDLKENPLPVQVTEQDRLLPSTLMQIDQTIEQLQAQIKNMQAERQKVLDRILETSIFEDAFCEVVRKDRVTRKLVPDMFKQQFPDAYAKACEIVKADLERQQERLDTLIGVTLAEKLVGKSGKHDFNSCCMTTVSSAYSVVEKE